MNNEGSLYIFNTQVEFKGAIVFMNNINFGDYGGAISAFLAKFHSTHPLQLPYEKTPLPTVGGYP